MNEQPNENDLETLWALLETGRPVRNYSGEIRDGGLHIYQRIPPQHWRKSMAGGEWIPVP